MLRVRDHASCGVAGDFVHELGLQPGLETELSRLEEAHLDRFRHRRVAAARLAQSVQLLLDQLAASVAQLLGALRRLASVHHVHASDPVVVRFAPTANGKDRAGAERLEAGRPSGVPGRDGRAASARFAIRTWTPRTPSFAVYHAFSPTWPAPRAPAGLPAR